MKERNLRLRNRSALIFYIVMFAYPITHFCIFYIGVNFNSFVLAFRGYDALTGEYSWAGLSNFIRFFQNIAGTTVITHAAKNSMILYGAGLTISLPLGLSFSYYIYKKRFMFNSIRLFLYFPSILSSIVMAILYKTIVTKFTAHFGFTDYLTDVNWQFYVILIFNLWIGFGPSVIIYSGAMSQISDSLIEAAKLDGASEFKQFFKVILPSIYPTITTYMIVGVANIFLNQANLFSFFQDGAFRESFTLGYYLFILIMGGNLKHISTFPYAAATGIILTVVAAPLVFFVKFLLEKLGPRED